MVAALPPGNGVESAPGSADSAHVVKLSPGAYTTQVSGANGTTGVALAEGYEVPYTLDYFQMTMTA